MTDVTSFGGELINCLQISSFVRGCSKGAASSVDAVVLERVQQLFNYVVVC
jgi:hypothetical protein